MTKRTLCSESEEVVNDLNVTVDNADDVPSSKKGRRFSAQEFRSLLQTDQKTTGILSIVIVNNSL